MHPQRRAPQLSPRSRVQPTGGTGMSTRALSLSTSLFVVVFSLIQGAAAQASPVRVPQTLPSHPGTVAHPPNQRQEPCWQVAGISKSAMEQRSAVQQRTRSEVEAVCADSSLTPQQRQQKIQQIHQQTKQELDALVSPQQMQEMKSCQMSRNHGGGHPGAAHPSAGGGHGPCGELPSRPKPTPSPGSKPEPESED